MGLKEMVYWSHCVDFWVDNYRFKQWKWRGCSLCFFVFGQNYLLRQYLFGSSIKWRQKLWILGIYAVSNSKYSTEILNESIIKLNVSINWTFYLQIDFEPFLSSEIFWIFLIDW
jgi:hypothetical protein